ncbi:hypothetical protein [Flavobacterium crassostreae]|uniref:Uncharacterized protein n=1 Tax=Flavobacterium crassostreae TaxID=1763534 RepID=A0A1B9E7M2_9FLAO|nr:hypothetical protein [Flavobacterium crassostreae]OCB77942.1 hypothetical protein LPBF_03070 [Flavobacterium crassostreae]
MQINLSKIKPVASKLFLYLGWILLLVVLWFKGCSKSDNGTQNVKVEVPEVVGKFQPKKPEQIVIQKSVVKEYLTTENPINEKLVAENDKLKNDFAKETDSLKKQILFSKIAQLNKFSTDFEDENVSLNINGIVQGEVKEITPSYTIKKKTIHVPVKQKETVLRLLVGGAFGANKEFNQVAYQFDLSVQNRKGDIISAEYLNISGQAFGMFSLKKSILNIKR